MKGRNVMMVLDKDNYEIAEQFGNKKKFFIVDRRKIEKLIRLSFTQCTNTYRVRVTSIVSSLAVSKILYCWKLFTYSELLHRVD